MTLTGPARKIFIEFLERSCTAEFSGFLLYKVGSALPPVSCTSHLHQLCAIFLLSVHTLHVGALVCTLMCVRTNVSNLFVDMVGHTCVSHVQARVDTLQELGRRLKKTNPAVAEIFTLMSRDEARHAGFLNKVLDP